MRNPRDFGRTEVPRLAKNSELSGSEFAWAWYQHRVSFEVHRALQGRGKSVEDFAQVLGADVAWLTRKLHGQAPADIGEMFEWALRLDVSILPPIDEKKDLLPSVR